MSFFGFETSAPTAPSNKHSGAEEDVAVYTWGDVSYDALGDALEETGDDLNDETFGAGPVGMYRIQVTLFLTDLLKARILILPQTRRQS